MKKSEFRNSIREMIFNEAKKGKKSEPKEEETYDVTDLEADIEAPETETDMNLNTGGDEGSIDSIQQHLNSALKGAKSLGDKKLTRQIGNTLTYLTRTQINNTDEL